MGGFAMKHAQADFPPVVYIPTTVDEPGTDVRVEMQRTADGRVALFSYSAIDRLHTMYRDGSPWLLVNVEDLQAIHDDTPYNLLFLDVEAQPTGAEVAS